MPGWRPVLTAGPAAPVVVDRPWSGRASRWCRVCRCSNRRRAWSQGMVWCMGRRRESRRPRVRRPCVGCGMAVSMRVNRHGWASQWYHGARQARFLRRWPGWFDARWRGPLHMRSGSAVGLVALVALELPLFHEFLSFCSKRSIVSVCELTLLRVVNGPPLDRDLDTASDAHFLARLLRIRRCVT